MYGYGHGSWIAVVIFAGMFALRAYYSRRGRGMGGRGMGGRSMRGPGIGGPGWGGSGPTGPGQAFTGDPPSSRHEPAAGPPPANDPSASGSGSGLPAGWFTDPFFKHQQRYWSGTEWTAQVSDNGTPGTDPPPGDERDET
jgi:hypothetical protein